MLGKLEGAAAVLPQARPTCSSSNPQRGEVAGGYQASRVHARCLPAQAPHAVA